MGVISAYARKQMGTSTFGLPKQRKYPINDRAHAANAKARATQMEKKGRITPAQKQKIDAKANRKLRG